MLATALTTLIVLILLSLPVAAVMGVLGLILAELYSPMPLVRTLGDIAWSTSTNNLLVAIPMFVLLGEILLRTGVSSRMYMALSHWLGWLPGGLMHSNIGTSALFAATSGSSVATAATVGTVALPEVPVHGYNERLFLGTLAAGGTLGILIPPSINMIIYAVMTNTSLPRLYLAGILPGLLLAGLFMVLIAVACLLNPKWGGQRLSTSWRARLTSLPHLLPPAAIFAVVVGSIYAGFATPTEAAALGVIAALILAAAFRALNIGVLLTAFEGTMRTTAMIILIIIAAYFLNLVFAAIGLADAMEHFVTTLGLGPYQTILVIALFYIVLGCFMETLSMMIATVPIVTPIVVSLGFDPVWFGIVLMLLLETALVTPPIGLNLFVVQSIRPGRGSMNDVMVGAMPFVGMLLVMIGLVIAFPAIALWLPGLSR
ncbi:Neu5Ac permease [Thalassovita gelatinovora]|uniref:TRAP transporter large permease protein n=1 Tax=Thalassovita gelatinovora TaxID=53501 RepID=A0A0P1FNT2_THAGE|nr:TRAP transporter large permease [Thalassovita gelatinovora]QIZ81785.1 TRAP transporter large permease [Thalassovita gelatinovora]CUH62323.1 Neu5Ac permease [Thalassovita gelatinovora]SER15653.1 TRAP transporter, DctM subunit [Thalassovita gelatinovora]